MSTSATSSSSAAGAAPPQGRRIPRWRDLSQIRRADLYLRTSIYALLWLVPGFTATVGVLSADDGLAAPPQALLVLGAGVLTLAAATAVLRDVIALHPARGPLPWRSLGPLALAFVLTGLVGLLVEPLAAPLVLSSTIAVSLTAGGLRDRWASATVMASLFAVPLAATGSTTVAVGCLAYGLFMVFTIRSSLWLYGVIAELDRARRAQSALAVAEERLRFSRDVHDVMGRRLSTIAVQAELASSLARRGDPRAAEQMLEVRGVAHDALREARELARGYRETDLATELEGARSLLASAGIACEVTVDDVPPPWREPAAWVVREAVTNVLRHSTAARVTITWVPAGPGAGLTVADDGGAGRTTGEQLPGSGLRGLDERLRPLGAQVEAGPTEAGFVVRMTVEGTA